MHKKAEEASPTIMISIISSVLALVVILLIYMSAKASVMNAPFISSTACWASNGMKCGGGLMTYTPSFCAFEEIEESVSTEELSGLLRDTYWMYRQGRCDFENIDLTPYTIFAFRPKSDIKIEEILMYMLTHNRGDETTDITKSDFAFIEKNTIYQTLCFDGRDSELSTENILKKDKIYYIHYIDRQKDKGDRIMITSDPYLDTAKLSSFIPVFDLFKSNPSNIKEVLNFVLDNSALGVFTKSYKIYYAVYKSDKPGEFCVPYETPIGVQNVQS